MKKACALCFGVALSLFAARAGAQVDSSFEVSVYCGPIADSCTASAYCKFCEDQSATFRDQVGYDGTFQLGNMNLSGPIFNIDTVDSQITNLTLLDAIGNGSASITLQVVFSPIPFHNIHNTLAVTPGKYPCAYTFNAGEEFCELCSASCSDAGSTFDSVSLEISPPSSVRPVNAASNFVTYFDVGTGTLVFTSANSIRELRIMNILGSTVFNSIIQASESSAEILLPPGCYFARLGGAVAKFVVPPR